MKYTCQRYLAASPWQNRKRCKSQNRSALSGGWAILTCILNGGTCTWGGGGGDGGDINQFAQAAGGHDIEALPRRSDTTESVYSSGPTPPASMKQALTRLDTERFYPDPAVGSLSLPSPVWAPTPSPQTPTYSQRDLQRQQEVRGKLGPKVSSRIVRRSVRRPAEKALRANPLVLPHKSSQLSCLRWWRKHPRRWHLHQPCSRTCHYPLLTSLGWGRRRLYGTDKFRI